MKSRKLYKTDYGGGSEGGCAVSDAGKTRSTWERRPPCWQWARQREQNEEYDQPQMIADNTKSSDSMLNHCS
jgi:hypothetical protein